MIEANWGKLEISEVFRLVGDGDRQSGVGRLLSSPASRCPQIHMESLALPTIAHRCQQLPTSSISCLELLCKSGRLLSLCQHLPVGRSCDKTHVLTRKVYFLRNSFSSPFPSNDGHLLMMIMMSGLAGALSASIRPAHALLSMPPPYPQYGPLGHASCLPSCPPPCRPPWPPHILSNIHHIRTMGSKRGNSGCFKLKLVNILWFGEVGEVDAVAKGPWLLLHGIFPKFKLSWRGTADQ